MTLEEIIQEHLINGRIVEKYPLATSKSIANFSDGCGLTPAPKTES